jgi:hypothetical protein
LGHSAGRDMNQVSGAYAELFRFTGVDPQVVFGLDLAAV